MLDVALGIVAASARAWRDGASSASAARSSTRARSPRSGSTAFRYDDGEEAEREIVAHPGAVAIVAHDGERLYLVRQPREAVGEQELLELPAGKLDEEGEDPLETAKRELAEEIGKGAASWEHLKQLLHVARVRRRGVHLFLATDLYDEQPRPTRTSGSRS